MELILPAASELRLIAAPGTPYWQVLNLSLSFLPASNRSLAQH